MSCVWLGYFVEEFYSSIKRLGIKDLEGKKIKIVAPIPSLLSDGVIFVCETGERIFYKTGTSPNMDRDFVVNSGVFSEEEILLYDERVRVEEKKRKKRRCEEDKKELERLKKRLGEC